MKRKVLLLAVIVMVIISSFAIADESPKQILQKGDVEKFIKTYPALSEDMKNFGIKMDAKEGNITYPDAVKASMDFQAILKKHGWDEGFFNKIQTIVVGYSYLTFGSSLKEANVGIAKALAEIDSNPGLSAEMKAQLKAQMKESLGALDTESEELQKSLHPADMAMIKAKVKELGIVLKTKNN